MATIREDYVSFETAKLLKKKGFEGYSILTIYDEEAANTYIKELKEKHLPYSSDDPKLKEFYYTQPTLQMAMKWLREVHHIEISITFGFPFINGKEQYKYFWSIVKVCNNHLEYSLNNPNNTTYNEEIADSYEQACEEAIKYCLENLI